MYHHEEGEGLHVKTDTPSLHKTETERRAAESSDSESDSTADEKNDSASIGRQESTVEEIRGGIPYEHDVEDVEADPPELEKKKSSKSLKDPNLVGYPECFHTSSCFGADLTCRIDTSQL